MSYRVETKFKETVIGLVPEDWKVKKVSDICEVVGGGTPNTKNKLYWNGNIPWITPKDLSIINKKYISQGERKITVEGLKNSNAKLLPPNALLLTSRAPIGYIAISKNSLATNQGFKNLIPKNEIEIEFLYYLLKQNIEYIKNYSSGSTFQEISGSVLREIKLSFPGLKEQINIAHFFEFLDDKVELNNKINKTLKQIGQVLFKHWFIDFEFPNEQGKPYKSSGGEFIDSELGKIPKGWKICKLLDCGKIVCGKTPPKSNKNYFGGNIPFIKIPDMHNNIFIIKTEDSLTEEGKKFQENKNIPAKSIIVSCIATVGLVSITSSESQTNQQINSLIPLYEPSLYYLYFKLKTLKDYFNTLGGSGSTTLNINTKIFSNIKVIMPTNNILEKFNKIVSPIFNSISRLPHFSPKFNLTRHKTPLY